MGFAQDALPIGDRFGLIGLPFVVNCCMILNILIIKSPSREMVGLLDAATAMAYLLGPISLALSGHHNRSNNRCKERQSSSRTCGKVRSSAGQPRRDSTCHDQAAAAHQSW